MHKKISAMTPAEFRLHVQTTAKGLAVMSFQRRNPTAMMDDAYAHAERAWREWIDRAITFIAIQQETAEQEAMSN